jgi:hypothetical protein
MPPTQLGHRTMQTLQQADGREEGLQAISLVASPLHSTLALLTLNR